MRYIIYNKKNASLRGRTTWQSVFFILYLLFTLASCTDEFGDVEYINLSFEVNTAKLGLPEGVEVTYTDAVLTMQDYNHWGEILTYPITDIAGSVTLQRGYYSKMRFTAMASYRYNDEDISFPVACYLNGNNNPINMIHPQVRAKLPLERSTK